MRVLIAGRSASLLAALARTFAKDLRVEAATTKTDALHQIDQNPFDLVIACEHLDEGSGLEVLSHAAVVSPNTLRIFAARPSMLTLLKSELGLFGLFQTLPYPINAAKLSFAVRLARAALSQIPVEPPHTQSLSQTTERIQMQIRHVLLDDACIPTLETPTLASAEDRAALEETAELRVQSLDETAELPPERAPEPTPVRQMVDPSLSRPLPARTPAQMAVFERALARRNAEKLDALSMGVQQTAAPSTGSRIEVGSRAVTAVRDLTHLLRGRSRRAAIVVGSGVIAAAAIAGITFVLLNSNSSAAHSRANADASGAVPSLVGGNSWQFARTLAAGPSQAGTQSGSAAQASPNQPPMENPVAVVPADPTPGPSPDYLGIAQEEPPTNPSSATRYARPPPIPTSLQPTGSPSGMDDSTPEPPKLDPWQHGADSAGGSQPP